MISTKTALNALVVAGLADGWQWTSEGEGAFKETIPVVKSTQLSISDETYGDKSFLYFRCRDAATAASVADVLRNAGGKPDFKWSPDSPSRFEMQVSYFKGARHWE